MSVEWLTVEQVAAEVGVEPAAVLAACDSREITYAVLFRQVRIRRKDFEKYLEKMTCHATEANAVPRNSPSATVQITGTSSGTTPKSGKSGTRPPVVLQRQKHRMSSHAS
ncbi:helix-turn-helix domain-containing protein [Caenispirillum salinarum]|uniref:helix-turn-helix domain-containing protein n=1 Tax=Caenispirillum salinarum TaxID=859058 RepID=UPI000A06DF5A